ncbi:hypothetical protein G9H58_01780 [Aquirufa antheringensis]|jgi:hypothetical protein|uniref:hypothetical protein n=1 Tax=Aquirufa antheringensis TaxID=2516559 RepID=UPI0022A89B73|nr:hypothetical protein [Aquirufa antheringensis]MCZ2476781.1 hypothetical protein [Aquirufa antheringensis]
MNLKEIGILLVGLFMGSCLLIAYKYYIAKGKVFQISRIVVFKYILRFMLLVTFMALCLYTINGKHNSDSIGQKAGSTLFVIANNSSSLTWNALRDKLNELPEKGNYSLGIYEGKRDEFFLVIPRTNKESFLNLLEQANGSKLSHHKHVLTPTPPKHPSEDQFELFGLANDRWQATSIESNKSSIFSTNTLNGWIGGSYVRVYLVVLIVILVFIDSVFTAKAIKI